MKAYIYCRISTKNGGSIQCQIDKCVDYCNSNNLDIKYVYNHVKSARHMKNKELLNVIVNEMESKDILIIHSICRFSRNMLGGLQILDALEQKSIKIYSVDDKVGYNDIHDKFRFRQIMNCAELETDKISHRVKQSKSTIKTSKKRKSNNSIKRVKKKKCNIYTNSFIIDAINRFDNVTE